MPRPIGDSRILVRQQRHLFAVDQQPYLQGYLAAVLARAYLDWGLMPGLDIATGPGVVTPENVDAVMDGINKGRR